MPMDPGEIERMIKEALPDADVKLEDLVGDGDHWSATGCFLCLYRQDAGSTTSIDLCGPPRPGWWRTARLGATDLRAPNVKS